jgi:uncharacterized protein YjdB
MVRSQHGSVITRTARILLCYNFCRLEPARQDSLTTKENKENMSSTNQKFRLTGALAALAMLALAISCRGFFTNPTLSSISVGPANPTIETGSTNNTVQMTVFGTNNDGSTTSTPSVSWTISDQSVATVNTTGLVKSVNTGTATITATANQNPSITGSQTVNVTVGCIQSIQVKPSSGTVSNNSPTFPFTATALTCNGSPDITNVATWTSSNTSLATVSAGTVTIVSGLTTGGTVNITASSGNIVSNAAVVTVTP